MTSSPAALPDDARCPCGSGDVLGACCGPVLARQRRAPTAEALMRSRYTAFAVRDLEHLLRSWHPSTAPAREELADSLAEEVRWLRLEIHGTEAGGPFDDAGVVEFSAISKGPHGRSVQRERSRFVREDGAWLYLDGELD
jgi:SEC-C motif-containing protein